MKTYATSVLFIYFYCSLGIAFIYQLLKKLEVPFPSFITSYLNDFLVIPIVSTVSLLVVWKIKKEESLRLSIFHILTLVFLFSFFFEYYLPKTTDFYVADEGDILCYLVGGLIYYLLQRKLDDKLRL